MGEWEGVQVGEATWVTEGEEEKERRGAETGEGRVGGKGREWGKVRRQEGERKIGIVLRASKEKRKNIRKQRVGRKEEEEEETRAGSRLDKIW